MIHRGTLLKKSKYTCFLHNADGFVAHSVSDLGGVSGQVWAVTYSLVTFWRDCEYFCRGLPYVVRDCKHTRNVCTVPPY